MNSNYGFQLTLPKGWEEYTTLTVFGSENVTQISFELPTNDAEWPKNSGDKKTASVFNLTIYPISSKSIQIVPGRKEILRNDKYIAYYDRIDKISDYPKDFTAELFNQTDEIIKTFKWVVAAETADWQTYRNKKYDFEFKQPKNWEVDTERTSANAVVFADKHIEAGESREAVSFKPNGKNLSIDQIVDDYIKEGGYTEQQIKRDYQIKIGGERTVRIETNEFGLSLYMFVHDGTIFTIETQSLFTDDVLKTFKFTN